MHHNQRTVGPPRGSGRPALCALVALGLATASCSAGTDEGTGPPDPLSAEESALAETFGAPAAAALAEGLVARLGAAIDERGVAGAVDFCADEAIALTQAIQAEHDPRLEIKRTTTLWRNPDNAPDEAEARVLAYLESLELAAPGSAPPMLTASGPQGSLRFYRVLRTAPLCLQCHGSEDALAPEVRPILAARYPNDRATGYGEGDFRGVIRVEIPADIEAP